MPDSEPLLRTKHAKQTPPYEWRAVEHADEALIVWDEPETETASAFEVAGPSRNVRALVTADAFLYEGNIVEAVWHEGTKSIRFCHAFAGSMDSFRPDEFLTEPAIRLQRLPNHEVTA